MINIFEENNSKLEMHNIKNAKMGFCYLDFLNSQALTIIYSDEFLNIFSQITIVVLNKITTFIDHKYFYRS